MSECTCNAAEESLPAFRGGGDVCVGVGIWSDCQEIVAHLRSFFLFPFVPISWAILVLFSSFLYPFKCAADP